MKCIHCKKVLHKVGVGIRTIVLREGKILLGQRKNTSHQDGCWETPGGHFEYGENFIPSAIRELEEETGLKTKPENCKFLGVTNDYFPEDEKHYVTVYVLCKDIQGEPQTMEPDKSEGWKWFSTTELPTPLTQTLTNFIRQIGFDL